MWSRVVLAFSCLFIENYISSQPLNLELDNVRLARQLDFGECCPCPGPAGLSDDKSRDALQSLLPRTDDLDDCPCRYRSADSDGSSSIFFPTATRPFAKQNDEKEEPKNLLEPEVDLASSMLETLREVTEEEYQDALARDAARAKVAEENMLKDAIPEESGRNTVTIIVSPRQNEGDEVLSDASHVQESRCIHPLGRTLGRIRMPPPNPSNVLNEILKLPKKRPVGLLHRNLLDIDSYGGASSVRENVVDPMGKIFKSSQGRTEDGRSIIGKTPIFTQSKQSNLLINDNGDGVCDDLGFASSNMQERFVEKQNPKLKLKSLIPIEKLLEVKQTTPLKNILKLKDVEFIRPENHKQNKLLPKLELKPLFNRNSKNLLDLNELLNGLKFNFKKDVVPENASKNLKTDILDSVPNTSNVNSKQTNIKEECEVENTQYKPIDINTNVTQIDGGTTTELLDSILSPSESEPIFTINDESNQEEFKRSDSNENIQNESLDENTNNIMQQESINMLELPSNEENQRNAEFLESMNKQHVATHNDNFTGKSTEHLNDLESNKDSLLNSNKLNYFVTQPIDLINDEGSSLSKTSNVEGIFLEEKASEVVGETILPLQKILSLDDEIPQVRKPLKSVKENFEKKLEEMKPKFLLLKPNILRLDGNKESVHDLIKDPESCQVNNISDNSGAETRKEDSKEIKDNAMSIAELQNLSNSLLKLSNKLEEQAVIKDDISKNDVVELNNDVSEPTTILKSNKTDILIERQLTPRKNGLKEDAEKSCPSDLDYRKIDVEEVNHVLKENTNEMDAEASEPIISKILKNTLGLYKENTPGDVIVEPSLFEDFPNIDNSNIFGNLPTVDDIRDQLSSIFGTNDRNNNENLSSKTTAEATCPTDDNEDVESLMSAEPSTLNNRLAPMDDMNSHFFQWKPIGAQPDILKSFRSNLKLPKNLEIKPKRLQSSLGNKSSSLGTLSIDSKHKPKSRLNTKSIFDDDLANHLKSPRGNLPNLEDFTSTLKENAQNLLNRGRELIPYNLEPIPSVGTLTENLRTHAENAAKNLQQTVESTLKQSRPSTLFSEHLSRPNDILQRIASVREDLNDKIIGLHHDFNDRLTTLHENIFDQSRFMSNRIPVMKSRDRVGSNNVQNLRKNKSKPMKLFTAESIAEPIEIINHERNNNFDKDIPHGNTRVQQERSRLRPYKPTSNIPVPKSVEVPRLELTSRKPPVALSQPHFRAGDLVSFPDKEKPSLKSKYRTFLRKEVNPFKDSKFTITFATTTQTPTTPMSKPKTLPASSDSWLRSTGRNNDFVTNRATSRMPKLKSFDTNVLPSEVQFSKLPAPTKLLSIDSENVNLDPKTTNTFKSKQQSIPIRTFAHSVGQPVNSNDADLSVMSRSVEDETKEQNDEVIEKPWSAIKWPKKVNDLFLTQVRESIKSRKNIIEPNKGFESNNAQISNKDMTKSASENTDIALIDKHLKENVTYKCKMICTRE
ncbi:hypothetical protein K1T71_011156 [Dendrolimus kikuchii]|uniref:Uncharacterized protein n=1 Tax=Dendrolimus kikuchii TaxID=765133 RepID=A0ACC1CN19_9NEOP|nr:hypothetical protein K1T71_011156 [Dendrolimus kikuchii]